MMKHREDIISGLIRDKLNIPVSSFQLRPVGGGSINETYKVSANPHQNFFLKLNSAKKFPLLFEKEKNCLEFLAKQNIIKVPNVIACEVLNDEQILLLEWIGTGARNDSFWKLFGEQLAQLHKVTRDQFGFFEDNYMGALPQYNQFSKNWVDFFIHYRLQPQIELAKGKNLLTKKHPEAFEKLNAKLPDIFNEEKPSLLHGDLWSGNYMCNTDSQPVLIDPAIYFGHRSIDLGMTTLFGGFDKYFYDSYNYYYPLPSNYHEQWEVCNLYQLLIHLNLFGSGYLSQIEEILKRFTC